MKVIRDIHQYQPDPQKPLFLGLGNFDGIHLGHQSLLDQGHASAQKQNGVTAAFTFQEHPQRVLHPGSGPKLLTTIEHKLFLFDQHQVDICFLVPFTEEFSHLTPEQFVQNILVDKLKVREVRMGYNAHFGYRREGTPETMAELANQHGFGFQKIEPVSDRDDYISSSRLREMIGAGQLEAVESGLGRPFSVLGEVIQGDRRGREIGFPTANLPASSEVMPPQGVYVASVREVKSECQGPENGLQEWSFEAGPWQPAVLNLGKRPTFEKEAQKVLLEVHLLDFEGDLYGKKLEVQFLKGLRSERAFEGPEALGQQISEDIAQARRYFSK